MLIIKSMIWSLVHKELKLSISHQKGDGIGAERIKFINSLSQSVVEKEPQGKRAAVIWVSALLPLRAQEGRRAGLWGERIAWSSLCG